ncbi:MAG: hypothetical protein Fur0040_07610 [Sideroxydans sp.]
MSPELKYWPAYLGLFAAQTLALTCNAFLDINYGSFTTEVWLWSIAFGLTLRTGWRQHGGDGEQGRRWMRNSLLLGTVLSGLIFLPMWGMPRAGVYMLAMIQVAYNCVTTTRRHLHLSLLISAVMVLFAASHFRADWTMLFYLVPYLVAVVFTLVAEQINRKAGELRRQSLGQQVVGAQWAAIAAATSVILLLGLALYALTPQVTWASLTWQWGQPAGAGIGDGKLELGAGASQGGNGGAGAAGYGGKEGGGTKPDWWSPGEMRKAAARPGMPGWQRDAINGLADLGEGLSTAMRPVLSACVDLWQAFKRWLKQHRDAIVMTLLTLGMLALLYALWRLLREARAATWLRTRLDYLRLIVLGRPDGARDCYEAMARLFELYDIKRDGRRNTREYLAEVAAGFRYLGQETAEMTRLYEDARYGKDGMTDTKRMRELYGQLYRALAAV